MISISMQIQKILVVLQSYQSFIYLLCENDSFKMTAAQQTEEF